MEHIERDTSKTEEQHKAAEEATKERKAVEKNLSALKGDITNIAGEIEKNREILEEYKKHKTFLQKIYWADKPNGEKFMR